MIKLNINYRPTSSGEFIGCVLEVPGAASQAPTIEKLKENLCKAALLIMGSATQPENYPSQETDWKNQWASPENIHGTIDVSVPVLQLIIDEHTMKISKIVPFVMSEPNPSLEDAQSIITLTNDDINDIVSAFHKAAMESSFELKGKPVFPKA